MRLKAKIRNLAKEKRIAPQVVLQNYMFERFLERLSKTSYKDNFILKGGMLIASVVGIANRSTMDMDVTIKNYAINKDSIVKAVKEICSVKIDDDTLFSFLGAEPIREGGIYEGYRIRMDAEYDSIVTPLSIDITTGDMITPREVKYSLKMIFEDRNIGVWAYNIETVLAEKVETILQRAELNTRLKDYYDIYILSVTQEIDLSIFGEALSNTAEQRNTKYLFTDTLIRLKTIESSEILEERWKQYARNYPYAKYITYEETVDVLRILLEDLSPTDL